MTIKKFLLLGIDADSNEENIGTWMSRFGPIQRVEIIRDGDPNSPVALLEMDISEGATAYLLSHLTDYWHEGRLLTARLLHH